MHFRKYIFDLKFTIKGGMIMKWGHGCKIWDCSIILHYFAVYLTCMLTLGLHSYRSSNLVIDLKMWEKFESNLVNLALLYSELDSENLPIFLLMIRCSGCAFWRSSPCQICIMCHRHSQFAILHCGCWHQKGPHRQLISRLSWPLL